MKIGLQFTALCVALGTAAGCHKKEAPTAEMPAPKVEGSTIVFPANAPAQTSLNVETAEPQKTAITHMTGRLYWDDDVTVRIFTPVAGRVTALRADVGQTLAVGAPLAEIDSPDFGQAQADARTAEGNLRAAEKAFNRAKELLAHGAAAQKDVENAEAADIAAMAARDSSRAKLALYGGGETGTNEIYVLRSPMAGMVVERNITPGQEVRADQMLANAPNLFAPLFVVTDPTKLWLQLDVAESDLSQVKTGQRLRVFSRAFPNATFDGFIVNIGAGMDPGTRTVRVRASVNNSQLLLKAEMYVLVDALTDPSGGSGGASAVEIPTTAVFQRDNQSYLFVERSPGQYQRLAVKTGREQDGKALILEGVSPGEKVVTDGCLLLEALFEAGNQS